ncbi:origin of replication complex subunit 3 isoform X2 [Mangifera indica]|nr:origin of replication complex subunit 3 isoform X2 [Mangifera indica]
MNDVSSKKLFTGLVLTKNMEFVDDLLTFEELGNFLKSQGCQVANLSSLDFTAKSGIGGCLRSLLRQFVEASSDAIDMSIIASWYREQGNYDNPVVVILNDIERCSGSILSNFILMLSEWVLKVPVILIMGVATTLDAPKGILPSNVLQCLSPYMFTLGSPAERMDAVVDAVLVKQCSGFIIGHKVALLMRNHFVRQDGTLTSFIRALKIACVQHFSMEPLSFLLRGFSLEEDGQVLHDGLISKMLLKHFFNLPSYERNKTEEQSFERFAVGLSELKRLKNQWGTMLLCLYEAAKGDKIQLLDLLCEALDPTSYNSTTSDSHRKLEKDTGACSLNDCPQYPMLRRGSFICQVVCKVKDLPATQLWKLLKRWEKLTMNINEMREKIKELLSLLKLESGKSSKQDMVDISKRHASRSQLKIGKDSRAVNLKAATLMECMVWDYMQPIECLPFHEIVCFKNVETLQLALIGDPRRRIQADLLEFYNILRCGCCSKSGGTLLPSMHDTSIMYNLSQEHGDHINLHDWYNSFKSTVLCPIYKGKNKSKQSPVQKKRKEINEPKKHTEASIQARFCRAVTELQITGLIRMPTKRRPDYVQRVAFGL